MKARSKTPPSDKATGAPAAAYGADAARRPPSGPRSLAFSALLVALAGVPAFFNIQSNTSFEPDKAALVRSLALLIAGALLWDALQSRKAAGERRWVHRGRASVGTPGDRLWWIVGALVLVTAVSALLAADPVTALWGNYERGMGLLALLAGVAVMAAACAAARDGWLWTVIDAILIGAAVPVFYGLVQLSGYDPVRAGTVSFALGQRAAGSLGNPLFLGDFLLLALILALARLFGGRHSAGPHLRRWQRWGLGLYVLMVLAALIGTGSRSALFGLLAASIIFFLAWGQQQGRRAVQLGAGLALLAGLLILLAAWLVPNVLPPRLGDLFASGGTGGQRLLIWQAVGDLLAARPRLFLLGLGPDNLALRLAPYTPAALAHYEVDWAFRIPDRAHTFPLDLLSQIGLIGLGLWTLFWASLQTRLLPRRQPAWLPIALQLAGAVLGAALAAIVVGWPAAPLGFVVGLLAGLALALLPASPDATREPDSPPSRTRTHALRPYLLAALAGHWMVLGFSFPTHAADLLVWAVGGLAVGIGYYGGGGGREAAGLEVAAELRTDPSLPLRLSGVAAALFGFSLSAALPRSVLLWLSAGLLLYLLALLLTGASNTRRDVPAFLMPLVTLLPALALNRFSGVPAWLAYSWLLVWLFGQCLLMSRRTSALTPLPDPHKRRRLLVVGGLAPLAVLLAGLTVLLLFAVLLNAPVYGDIAFKSALLHRGEGLTSLRRTYMARALLLSPYDHVLAAGIAPTENELITPAAALDDSQAQVVAGLYERAIASQPLAPEAVAAYAEWLRQRAAADPSALAPARSRFEQTLALSPNDIESRNRLALLKLAAGDKAGAQSDLKALLALDPLYGPTYLHLASLYQQVGDVNAARELLREGQQRVPWWDGIPRALAALDGA